jgi:PAS domain S-box-containing protein
MTLLRNKNSRLDFSRIHISVALRTTLVLVVYIITFIFLDWLTLGFQSLPNVVAWYPPSGVSFALLLALGARFAPVLAITSFISSFFIYKVSPSIEPLVVWSIVVSVVYGVAAALLRRRVRFDPQLRSMRDVFWLIFASVIVSAILAVGAIDASVSGGIISASDRMIATLTWWIGETVGVLVMTPFLLIHVMPSVKQFLDGTLNLSGKQQRFPPRPKHMVARTITLLVVLYLAYGVPALQSLDPIYLIAIPLIWISMDHGIKGASVGITIVSFATMGAVWLYHVDPNRGDDVQLLMLVLSIASLVIGMIRTEQIQTIKELDKSEKRFRALIENSLEEVSLVSVDGKLIYESPTTRRPLGYPAGSFVGRNLSELLHPDDQANAIMILEQVFREPGSHREEVFRLRHQDGSWRWMEGIVHNLLDEPAIGAIVINYHDVTDRRQADEEIRTRSDQLSTLYELSRALAEANDLDTVLDLVNRRTVESLHTTFARIALLTGDELITRSAYPIRVLDRDLFAEGQKLITDMPYCQRVLAQGEPAILRSSNPEVSDEERVALLLDFAQVLCLIPLHVHDFAANTSRTLGVLMVGEVRNEEREPFTPEKMNLARSIGDQAAISIENTRLFHDLQRSSIELSDAYNATIAGWSAALDLRDKETEGHTQRVTEMSCKLAKDMGLGEQELIQVRRGALLHDIGKMGVPDRILLKPDKLTDEEWIIMRMHPSYAFQMLKPITYLRLALDIPYCHHEKWDGTGYPRGLKGEEIPLAARIFAIVDVYDALTSDRPYRAGWSREKTLGHIRELSGSHFDPQVVDAFLKMGGDTS